MYRYKAFLYFSFTVLSAGLLTSLPSTAQQTYAPLPQAKDSFIVISHRGNHVNVPENTLASLEEAIKAGANYAEIDLRTTKDSFLVLSHDASVDRMTDGKGNVKDLTLAQIKALKIVGHAKEGDHKVYRIPEFKDVLKVCKGRINIYLDFKDADPEASWQQIKAAGMEKQIVVYLNKVDQYKKWKKAAPAMPLMTSVPDNIKTAEQLSYFLAQAKIQVLDNVTDTTMLAVTRYNGVAVWVDVESPDEGPEIWKSMLSKGVQGMQTDHPEMLVNYLKENKWRNGAAALVAAARAGNGDATGLSKGASSGNGSSGAGTESQPAPYRTLPDIPYGQGDPDQTLDAYIPQEHENSKVIVYIHGGGWTGGDKKEFPKPLIDELVGRRKYIVISMNYRLVKADKNKFPAQIEDVRSVLSFVSNYAGKYHYDGNEFALMGGSAGAHLAMLYAYGYDKERQVKTVIDLWGPTDLADKAVRADNKDADSKVVNLLGVSDPQAQVCKDASPLYRLTKETGVPTILFHGGEDPLVNISQSEKLYKKLQDLNIPAQYEVYPHEKHGVGPESAPDVFKKTLSWLQKYYPSGVAATSSATGTAQGTAGVAPGAPSAGSSIPAATSSTATTTAVASANFDPTTTYAEKLGFPKGAKVIIFHVDDAGMSINSNEGAINSIEKGVATSTSVMMPCPWAAAFAKYAAEKGYDAGLHLTLTSEWNQYRWAPLAGVKQVPGLTDTEWCLWPEPMDVLQHASADEVETEIRAQLARALAVGLHPTHLDSHMGTLFASQAYLERYIKVGVENHIPVMFPGGNDKMLRENSKQPLGKTTEIGEMIWKSGLPVLDDLITYSGEWKPEPVNGVVTHEAYAKYKVKKFEETIEKMEPGVAMYIVHSTVVTDDFRHISGSGDSRFADMHAMMDPEFKAWLQSKGIILTTWRELMQRRQQVK